MQPAAIERGRLARWSERGFEKLFAFYDRGLKWVIAHQPQTLAVNGTTYSKTDHVLQGQRLAQAAQPSDLHSFAFDPASVNAAGNVQVLGRELFTTFLLPFEITSLLLFVAAIGAVYLTRRLPHAPGPPVERTAPVAALPEESAPDAGRETVAVG